MDYPRLGREPPRGVFARQARALREIVELVVADAPDGEVLRVRMRKIEAGDRRGRQHREAFGEGHAEFVGTQDIEERRLDRVIGTGRIPRRRPDARIFLAYQRATSSAAPGA
jgi:hypothetical protein